MTNFKEFSDKTWDLIKSRLDTALSEIPEPWYAAFDADGTLWDNDAGNKFFDYEIDNNLLDLPKDPWGHVYSIKANRAEDAFLWLAQIHKNKKISEVKKWAEQCFLQEKNYPYFESIKNLIEYLQFKGVEIIVVTASVKWAVEAPVKPLGIPAENVLGVTTKIENGIVTDLQDGPITYGKGKTDALLQHTNGVRPIVAAGNTIGDLELIDSSSHVKLAVLSATSQMKIYKSELLLEEHAQKHNWLIHRFR